MKKIFILLIIIFTTGCSYRELNKLAIANSIGIDYIDDNYLITVQVFNLKKDSENTQEEKSIVYKGTGESVASAIRNISLEYPRNLYLGHIELIILGESLLNKNMEEVFDYFIRSPEAQSNANLLINPSGTANEILEPALEKTNTFPSEEIVSTIENSMKKQGTAVVMNVEEFLSTRLQKGIDPVSTTIEKINDELKLTGMLSLNDNNKFKLNKEQAIAYNIVNSNFYDIAINTKYKDEKIDIILIKPKTAIKMNFTNDKLKINININLSGQTAEIKQEIDLENDTVQKEIQKSINKTIEEYFESLIKGCKENNIDILGLKNIIYKKYNKHYNQYKNENIYEIADIKIKINTDIYRYGGLYRSAKGE